MAGESGGIHEVSEALGRMSANIDNLTRLYEESSRKNEAFRKAVYPTLPQINSTAMKVDGHDAQLTALTQQVAALIPSVTAALTSSAAHANSIGAAEDRLAGQEVKLSTLEATDTKLATRVTRVENRQNRWIGAFGALSIVATIVGWAITTFIDPIIGFVTGSPPHP